METNRTKNVKSGGPVTHLHTSTIGALSPNVGYPRTMEGYENPDRDKLMYKAGFRTVEEMEQDEINDNLNNYYKTGM